MQHVNGCRNTNTVVDAHGRPSVLFGPSPVGEPHDETAFTDRGVPQKQDLAVDGRNLCCGKHDVGGED